MVNADIKKPKKDGWKTFSFWRRRIGELAVAGMISMVVIQGSDRLSIQQKEMLPASAWFQVQEIFVPDFKVGDNPMIIYDRTIRDSFRGFFVVEVQKRIPNGLWFSECSGSGIAEYDLEDELPDNTVSFDWFVNRLGEPCRPNAGKYRLKVTYELRKPKWPVKSLTVVSNAFEITD